MVKLLNKLNFSVICGGYYVCINEARDVIVAHEPYSGIFGLKNGAAKKNCCDDLGGFMFYQDHGELCPIRVKRAATPIKVGCGGVKQEEVVIQEAQLLTIESNLITSDVLPFQ